MTRAGLHGTCSGKRGPLARKQTGLYSTGVPRPPRPHAAPRGFAVSAAPRSPVATRDGVRDEPREGARERLLEAADALFYARGVRTVGIDEVIAHAGVAKASLYKHFASKDELVAEYVRRRDAAWRAWFAAEVERRGRTPRERLLAVFDALGAWFRDDAFRGCAFQNAAVELADRAHPAQAAVLANKRGVRAYLRDLARAAGAPDPDALAAQLGVLAEGAIVTALVDGTPAPARAARAAAETLVRAALPE